jgi:hypothetical protein
VTHGLLHYNGFLPVWNPLFIHFLWADLHDPNAEKSGHDHFQLLSRKAYFLYLGREMRNQENCTEFTAYFLLKIYCIEV